MTDMASSISLIDDPDGDEQIYSVNAEHMNAAVTEHVEGSLLESERMVSTHTLY